MSRRIFIVTLLIGMPIFVIYGSGNKEINDVEIIYETSFFNKFYIENNRVYIECMISINNNTNKAQNIIIIGFFDEDEGILLKEKKLYGYYNNNKIISLNPGGNNFLKIIFKGEFAERNIKNNRGLPKLELYTMQSLEKNDFNIIYNGIMDNENIWKETLKQFDPNIDLYKINNMEQHVGENFYSSEYIIIQLENENYDYTLYITRYNHLFKITFNYYDKIFHFGNCDYLILDW